MANSENDKTKKPEKTQVMLSPKIQKLKGTISLKADFDYKKLLEKEVMKKHGTV